MNLVEIKQTTHKGKGLFARRSIPKGATICTLEYPIMSDIESEHLRTTCYYCLLSKESDFEENLDDFGPLHLFHCGGCRSVKFCSQACEMRAWIEYHQHECDIYRKSWPTILDEDARAVLRLILLNESQAISYTTWMGLKDLHTNEAAIQHHRWKALKRTARQICGLVRFKVDLGTVFKLLCVRELNAFNIDDTGPCLGSKVYPIISRANHSCEPNAKLLDNYYNWKQMIDSGVKAQEAFGVVVARTAIDAGEEITISYLADADRRIAFQARREKLKTSWFFHCMCPRCLREERIERGRAAQAALFRSAAEAKTRRMRRERTLLLWQRASHRERVRAQCGTHQRHPVSL